MKQRLYKLRVADHAAAVIRTLHPHIKKKIKLSFEMIAADPNVGKALVDELSGLRSYRVGRFRIIYRIGPSRQVEIVAVGPRVRIYEETYRLVTKCGK